MAGRQTLLELVARFLRETYELELPTLAELKRRVMGTRHDGPSWDGLGAYALTCDDGGVQVDQWDGKYVTETLLYRDLLPVLHGLSREPAAGDQKQSKPLPKAGGTMATTGEKKRKTAKRPTDAEGLQVLVAQYEQVFGEVTHFIDLIARQELEISTAEGAMHEAKAKYEQARDAVNEAREARDGSKHALFMFLKPGPAEILPLFDRMEKADEEKHGAHADEWRKEPVAALRLSLIASNLLAAVDVLFVGQLQDRVQAKPEDWWGDVAGLTAPMALAIADKLNDFIAEHTER